MKLYKYISFETFISLIETQKSFLRNIKEWDDPFEGYIPFSQRKDEFYDIFVGQIGNLNEDARNEIIKYEKIIYASIFENHCYAQSWLNDENESDALWRIYSEGKGVRIGVDKDKLISHIIDSIKSIGLNDADLFSLNIEYTLEEPPLLISEENIDDKEILFKQIAGYKRMAFKHENEYRIGFFYPVDDVEAIQKIKDDIDQLRKSKDVSDFLTSMLKHQQLCGVKLNIDPIFQYDINLDMITEIILDPRSTKYQKDLFFAYCKNKKLENYKIEYYQSGLYNRGKS